MNEQRVHTAGPAVEKSGPVLTPFVMDERHY